MFEVPYFLVPAKGGEKGYVVLAKALQKSGKFAVVQAVLRTKEQLGVIYAKGEGLLLDFMRYPAELKESTDIIDTSVKKVKVTEREIEMAERLLQEMSEKFDPKKYKDNYISKVQAAIDKKIGSKKTSKVPLKKKTEVTRTIDIVDLLAQSLKKRLPRNKKAA